MSRASNQKRDARESATRRSAQLQKFPSGQEHGSGPSFCMEAEN